MRFVDDNEDRDGDFVGGGCVWHIFFFRGLVSIQCGTNVFWRDFCQHRKLGGVILNED